MLDKRFEYCTAIERELRFGEKHNKRSIEKIAESYGLYNKNLIKEMTELAIVRLAREICEDEIPNIEKYSQIVELYNNQVNLSHRTSQSMIFQQYSTAAPISYIASLYVRNNETGSTNKMYFEPSAGNGLLTIAIPYKNLIVNEIDDVRYENLKSQLFNEVTSQDASQPFPEYFHKFDGIITNPPFGSLMDAVDYDSFPIKTLDHLMALRALDCMRDDGRAAVIIGGHTQWDEMGRIQAGKNRLFFNYLYSHYNVEDVILIDGHKLYSRQGTAFNTRLILINGRKPEITGVAPLKNETLATVITDFDQLIERAIGKRPVDNTTKLKMKMKAKSIAMKKGLSGDFGPVYTQFEKQPKKAIQYLVKKQEGEAVKALYREDIGFIDIVWGENDPKTNKGFGLKHIIEKHGADIKAFGFEIEDFIPIIITTGSLIAAKEPTKIILESNVFRAVILKEWKGKKKQFILTAFNLIKKK
ncbi:MAG: hypothetical protein JXR53_01225 [Bacteroidales bacterium]|nr:hypothetical protein [Bacteroidales bacterium]